MRTLLDLFMTQERDTARMLDEMVVRGDIALARHKVHELKGSAGSVGALATQAATTGLDAALVDEDRVADRLRTLRNALDQDMLAMRVLAASAPGHLGI
jgi:HPt (histidine-containing phosphotransfer) domain-containing protein